MHLKIEVRGNSIGDLMDGKWVTVRNKANLTNTRIRFAPYSGTVNSIPVE